MNRRLPSRNSDYRSRPQNTSRISPGLRLRSRGKEHVSGEDLTYSQIVRFLFLHVPVMFVFRAVPMLATAHSVLVVMVGLYYILRDKTPRRVIWVLAYITSSEIMWRGTEAVLVWEYAKYVVLMLTILMIFKFRLIEKGTLWPVFFVLILLPGIFVAPWFDREAVSYELSGPITLAAVSFAFNGIKIKRSDLQRLFVTIMGPATSMAVLIVFMVATNDITFYNTDVNELVTGWIGANQVTSTLSLGATAAFFYIFILKSDRRIRNLMLICFTFFLTTSVLTFSRAGLWNTVGAVVASLFFLVRDRNQLLRIQGVVLAIGVVGYFIVFPLLVNITGGAVAVRFASFDSTGRDRLVMDDLKTFRENWVTGVGVGQARYLREHIMDRYKSSHTEYTRLLTEHGVLGILAILILLGVAANRAFKKQDPAWKGIVIGFTVWAFLYMAHSATRMVSVAFTFGFVAASYLSEETEEETEEETSIQELAHPDHFRR